MAKEKVMAIFPVTFIPNGVKPNIFKNQIKKNMVNKNGMYFLYRFSPIFGLAISSRMYNTIGSKKRPIPVGTPLFLA